MRSETMRSFAIAVLTPVQYRSQPLRGRCSSSKLRGLDKVEAMRRLSQPRLHADELTILDCRPMGCAGRQDDRRIRRSDRSGRCQDHCRQSEEELRKLTAHWSRAIK